MPCILNSCNDNIDNIHINVSNAFSLIMVYHLGYRNKLFRWFYEHMAIKYFQSKFFNKNGAKPLDFILHKLLNFYGLKILEILPKISTRHF